MTLTLRRLATALAATAVAGAAALTSGGAAHATTTPPWEPDSSSKGGLIFYDASGNVISGGNISDTPIAAYVQGTSAIRAGDTKATLYGYLPVNGQVPGQWQGEAMSASTAYPPAGAPSAVSKTLPVVTGAADDESVATLADDYPNTDTTNDGYAGIYQLRLKTTAAGQPANTTYDSADILISGNTWSVAYDGATTPTTTALSVSPPSPVFHGDTVTLTATVAPNEATGTVKFLDGATVLGTKPLSNGQATFTTSSLSDATHQLSASFVPSGSSLEPSTSAAHSLVVEAHPTTTTLKAKKAVKKGKKLKLKAKEAPAYPGKIVFRDRKKKLGSVKVNIGKAVLATKKLKKPGKHKLTATFVPSNTEDAAPSTSKAVTVKVKK
jgi:hypothetical protein